MFLLAVSAEDAGNDIFRNIITWCTSNGMTAAQKILIALIILWLGFKLIRIIKKRMERAFQKHNLDVSLQPIIANIVNIALKILLLIVVIGYLGIPMTSFVALLGAAGLAVGMALSGTIQNLAGGILILVFRPFKLGDYIAAQGFEGTVQSIKIFSTTINTVDNKLITLPNGALSAGTISNYSTMATRRVDVKLQVAAGEDVKIDEIEKDLLEICAKCDKIVESPAPSIWFSIGPGTVAIETKAWCNSADYWTVYDYLHRAIYNYNVSKGFPCPYTVVDFLKKQE